MSVKSPKTLVQQKDIKINKLTMQDKNISLLDNKYFKRFIFSVTITGTIIMNLGYIKPSRDSSKVDFII